MSIVKSIPRKIENDFEGVTNLLKIYHELMQEPLIESVVFDFQLNKWFEANMVTILATVFESLYRRHEGVKIYLENVNSKVENIFKKNGFYDSYNLGLQEDTYNSTIKFVPFSMEEEDKFSEYLEQIVMPKINLNISQEEKRYFKTCMQEIFQNTKMHASSDILYTCGQFFPQKSKVALTLADIGVTIGENVRKKLNDFNLNDADSINWATDFGNTTKIDDDGGIGLHMLKQYIEQNGELIIVSGNGYWESKMGKEYHRKLKYYFNGTIINICTNLSYELENDLHEDSLIF